MSKLNKDKFKIVKYVVIAFFLFLVMDNVSALECVYYKAYDDENSAGLSISGDKARRPILGTKPLVFKIENNIINLTYYTGYDVDYNEGEKREVCGADNSKWATCPDWLAISGYGIGLGDQKSPYCSKKRISYIDGSKYSSMDDFKDNSGIYKSDYHIFIYLENPNMLEVEKKINEVNKVIESFPGNSLVGEASSCPLKKFKVSSVKDASAMESHISNWEKIYDALKSTSSSVDSLIDVATKKIITPNAMTNKKTLRELSVSDKIYFENLPKALQKRYTSMADSYNKYVASEKIDISTGQGKATVQYNIAYFSDCYAKDLKRIYSDVQKKAKKDSSYKNSEKRLKKLVSSYSKLTKSSVKKTNENAKKEEANGKETDSNCESILSAEFANWLKGAYTVIKIAAIALTIVFGMLDFSRALATSEDNGIKKSGEKFIKRVIATVIIFLLPILINFILSIFDVNVVPDPSCMELEVSE